jgi:hypothetical protein
MRGRFWQRRFYDFNVWSADKLREKLEYMHANPVKRKRVLHPRDWPWSSWSHYAKGEKGLIRIDSVEEGKSGGDTGSIEEEKSESAPLKPKGVAPPPCPAAKGLAPVALRVIHPPFVWFSMPPSPHPGWFFAKSAESIENKGVDTFISAKEWARL